MALPSVPDADRLRWLEQPIVLRWRADQEVQAVKAYRDATGAGLKEAEDAVDDLRRARYVVEKGSITVDGVSAGERVSG